MASGKPQRRATLASVAARAGVSVMTASYTYNNPSRVSDEARSRVLAAAGALGYSGPDPKARSLRRGRTDTVGVVLGEHLTYAFEDPQAASFLAGIAEVCAVHGCGMTILPITGGADDVKRIPDAAVDGFIVWTTSDDDPVLAAVEKTRRPAVVHGGPKRPGLGLVGINNRAAAHAIGALAFAGAARPAVMSQPLSRQRLSVITTGTHIRGVTFPVTRERLAGYRAAAVDAGFAWRDVMVAVCSRNDRAEAALLATRLLTSFERPDAIAAMSDEQAAGVLEAAGAAGLVVPTQLAVTGFDDAVVAGELGLTTVAQSLRDQGVACAQCVIEDRPPGRRAPWAIIRRDSTRS